MTDFSPCLAAFPRFSVPNGLAAAEITENRGKGVFRCGSAEVA